MKIEEHEPTIEEIYLAAAKIRESWSPEEHAKRLVWKYDNRFDWNQDDEQQVA